MEVSQIVIYVDEGVDSHSFCQIIKGVREELPFLSVRSVKRGFFLSKDWESKTLAVIFPGGRDVPYHHALQGEANQRLKNYVKSGGHYLGICAGGYYGASSILFEEGGPLEIKAQRELSFYPGRAWGPVYGYGQFCYGSLSGARMASVSWAEGVTPVYFNGGCTFEHANKDPSVEILATYEDLPGALPAIVCCQYGQGQAILSGVHPEYGHKAFDTEEQAPQAICQALQEHQRTRRALWVYLLHRLLRKAPGYE